MTTTENALDCTTFAIEQVADIIANCAAFQEAVSRYSADDARGRIFKSYFKLPEKDVTAPYAVIFESAGTSWERRADSTQLPRGELFLELCLLIQNDDDPEGEERRFNNWHGQIAEAISSYTGAGYRMLTTQTDPPARTHPKDQGATTPRWNVGYSIAWSPF